MPPLSLSPEAIEVIQNYPWPGNIRQLKHVTEQMSVLEADRRIEGDTILGYLPETLEVDPARDSNCHIRSYS